MNEQNTVDIVGDDELRRQWVEKDIEGVYIDSLLSRIGASVGNEYNVENHKNYPKEGYGFFLMTKLTGVRLPKIKWLPCYAFSSTGISSFDTDESIPQCQYISPYCFWNTQSLNHVNLGENIKKIFEYGFNYTNLTTINLNKVNELRDYALANNNSLEEVLAPNVTYFGSYALYNNPSLKNVELSDDVIVHLNALFLENYQYELFNTTYNLHFADGTQDLGTKLFKQIVVHQNDFKFYGFSFVKIIQDCSTISNSLLVSYLPTAIVIESETLLPLTSVNTISTPLHNYGKKIYVPDNLVDEYKSATNWAQLSDYIFPYSIYDNNSSFIKRGLFETYGEGTYHYIEDSWETIGQNLSNNNYAQYLNGYKELDTEHYGSCIVTCIAIDLDDIYQSSNKAKTTWVNSTTLQLASVPLYKQSESDSINIQMGYSDSELKKTINLLSNEFNSVIQEHLIMVRKYTSEYINGKINHNHESGELLWALSSKEIGLSGNGETEGVVYQDYFVNNFYNTFIDASSNNTYFYLRSNSYIGNNAVTPPQCCLLSAYKYSTHHLNWYFDNNSSDRSLFFVRRPIRFGFCLD